MNQKNWMNWIAFAVLLAFAMFLAVGNFVTNRNEMLEWKENGITLEGKLSDKRTRTETRINGSNLRNLSRVVTIYELIYYYDDPADLSDNLVKDRAYTYVEVPKNVYESTKKGDKAMLFVNPENTDSAVLESRAAEDLSPGNMNRFIALMSGATLLFFTLIYFGIRTRRKEMG